VHLLCVDPAQRFSIDEFLQHPWCVSAPAPPIAPTPISYNPANVPLDSPLLSALRGGWVHEGRSPDLATLKEAFDITYAVHRMEEEGALRRRYHAPGSRGFLSGLSEGDEGNDTSIETTAPTLPGQKNDVRGVENGRTIERMPNRCGFELDLDGATLLGRRGKRDLGNISHDLTKGAQD
jgi:serine/threonine-protein kinase RCK2